MKKMMRFVKGKRKEGGDSDRRSESSFGSRSSLAAGAGPSHQSVSVAGSPAVSLSHAPMRLLQSSWSISQEDDSLIDPQSTKLHQAAAKGNTEKVLKHLKKTDVNSVDGLTRTPLHLAAAGGHQAAVASLLEAGASLDAQDRRGQTPLSRAAESGHLETVARLLERGADTDVADQQGETCVHSAVRAGAGDILGLVLRRGANPDIINYEGQSALHLAVTMVDTASVSTLLRHGALVNIRCWVTVCVLHIYLSSPQDPPPGHAADAGGGGGGPGAGHHAARVRCQGGGQGQGWQQCFSLCQQEKEGWFYSRILFYSKSLM